MKQTPEKIAAIEKLIPEAMQIADDYIREGNFRASERDGAWNIRYHQAMDLLAKKEKLRY
jgi:hypothetical protein